MFTACPQGYQIKFQNGLTISVMFGYMNYCANRGRRNVGESIQCEDAEFMVVRGRDYLYADGHGGDVGWKTPEQIAAATAMVASFNADVSKEEVIERINECLEGVAA